MWGIGSLPPPPPPCDGCKRPICRCPKPADPRPAADGRGLGDWHFAGPGGPGGPGDHPTRRGVKHPTFCRGFRGPRGRPDFSKRQMVIQISRPTSAKPPSVSCRRGRIPARSSIGDVPARLLLAPLRVRTRTSCCSGWASWRRWSSGTRRMSLYVHVITSASVFDLTCPDGPRSPVMSYLRGLHS